MRGKEKQNGIRTALRIILPIACLLWIAFILGNSLRTGEQSSEQSATVVEAVQRVAKVIAPESKIANATGDTYDRLHSVVRACAHAGEFAVLGALLCWCYFAYTSKLTYFYFPVIFLLLFPTIDECLQGFVSGRSGELIDLILDTSGGLIGLLLATLSVAIGVLIYERRTRKGKAKAV